MGFRQCFGDLESAAAEFMRCRLAPGELLSQTDSLRAGHGGQRHDITAPGAASANSRRIAMRRPIAPEHVRGDHRSVEAST